MMLISPFTIFFLSFLTIIIYFSYIIKKIPSQNKKIQDYNTHKPLISIIIPACNEEKIIATKIENTLNLEYPNLEIIVISDGSTDKTIPIAKQYSNLITILELPYRMGKPSALNHGVKHANGEIIIFTDTSVMLKPNSIEKLLNGFEFEDVGICFGNIEYEKIHYSSLTQGELLYWNIEHMLRNLQAKTGYIFSVIGGCIAIKKELFKHIPKHIILDDLYLALAIYNQNKKAYYCKDIIGTEKNLKSTIGEMQRKIRLSAGAFQFLFNYYKKINNPIAKITFWTFKGFKWLFPLFFLLHIILVILKKDKKIIKIYSGIIFIIFSELIINTIYNIFHNKKDIKIKITFPLFYFIIINISGIIGFLKFVSNTQNVLWRLGDR